MCCVSSSLFLKKLFSFGFSLKVFRRNQATNNSQNGFLLLNSTENGRNLNESSNCLRKACRNSVHVYHCVCLAIIKKYLNKLAKIGVAQFQSQTPQIKRENIRIHQPPLFKSDSLIGEDNNKFLNSVMQQEEGDKILLIGNSTVGKSSLLVRFADGIFIDNLLPTIGVDFKIRAFEAEGSVVKLKMWDTAGQEKFKTITSAYYKGAHGVILTYDITDRKSFEDLQNWLGEVDNYCNENVVKILVGNKKDLESQRQVSRQEAKAFAEGLGIKFLETSAKDGMNIDEIFINLAVDMKRPLPAPQLQGLTRPTLINPKTYNTNKKTCC